MKPSLSCSRVPISRLQRFDYNSTVNLGRWPRLLHHAPLALKAPSLVSHLHAATAFDIDRAVDVVEANTWSARADLSTQVPPHVLALFLDQSEIVGYRPVYCA